MYGTVLRIDDAPLNLLLAAVLLVSKMVEKTRRLGKQNPNKYNTVHLST